MAKPVSYKRHRFPPEIIAHAVWLYFRFPLSLRLIEEMLLERGTLVSYETVRRWALKFGPDYARCRRELCGNSSGAISGMNIVLGQAARSIVSFAAEAWGSVFQPSTLRMVI